MSLTNVTSGDNKEIDTDSQQRTSVQNRNEQPTPSGIRTQVNVKLTALSRDSKKRIAHSSSLSSLDELAGRLQEQHDKDDIRRAVSQNLTDTFNLKKNESSRSLNELTERLKKLKNNENSSAGAKIHDSISTAVVSGSPRSTSKSISSMENLFLKETERIKENQSFVDVEPCQKEIYPGTNALTVFVMDNITVAKTDRPNRPLPPSEYTQRGQYQGYADQTAAYQTQDRVRDFIFFLKSYCRISETFFECLVRYNVGQ